MAWPSRILQQMECWVANTFPFQLCCICLCICKYVYMYLYKYKNRDGGLGVPWIPRQMKCWRQTLFPFQAFESFESFSAWSLVIIIFSYLVILLTHPSHISNQCWFCWDDGKSGGEWYWAIWRPWWGLTLKKIICFNWKYFLINFEMYLSGLNKKWYWAIWHSGAPDGAYSAEKLIFICWMHHFYLICKTYFWNGNCIYPICKMYLSDFNLRVILSHLAQWRPWWGLTLQKALLWSKFHFQYFSCSIVLVPLCDCAPNINVNSCTTPAFQMNRCVLHTSFPPQLMKYLTVQKAGWVSLWYLIHSSFVFVFCICICISICISLSFICFLYSYLYFEFKFVFSFLSIFVFIFVFCICNWIFKNFLSGKQNTLLLRKLCAACHSDIWCTQFSRDRAGLLCQSGFQPVSSIDRYFGIFQTKFEFSLFQIHTFHTFYTACKWGIKPVCK